MNLQQVNIEFVAEQDRLLMRLATGDRAEIVLWLTRRCVKLLWPHLVKMAESTPIIAQQAAPEARHALLDMERERALSKANFSKQYDNTGRERPLGAEPLLIARMNAGRNDQGHHVLALAPREGTGINLAMDDTLLHGVCKLLQDAVARSEWDIKLVLPTGAAPPGADRGPKVLN